MPDISEIHHTLGQMAWWEIVDALSSMSPFSHFRRDDLESGDRPHMEVCFFCGVISRIPVSPATFPHKPECLWLWATQVKANSIK